MRRVGWLAFALLVVGLDGCLTTNQAIPGPFTASATVRDSSSSAPSDAVSASPVTTTNPLPPLGERIEGLHRWTLDHVESFMDSDVVMTLLYPPAFVLHVLGHGP
jgi:hypothetical protein